MEVTHVTQSNIFSINMQNGQRKKVVISIGKEKNLEKLRRFD
jgi:hypothetical protein